MEEYLLRLEQMLADSLGGALLAQTVSKLIVISVAALVIWAIWKLLNRFTSRLSTKFDQWRGTWIQGVKIQNQKIISERDVARLMQAAVKWLGWILKTVLVLGFLNIVFFLFSWSRNLSIAIIDSVLGIIKSMAIGFVEYLPDLAVIIVVVFIARFIIHLLRLVFKGINKQRIAIPGFYPEWSRTSFNLLRIIVIALTLVVIFPYFPGSSSPAFQGVSIFVGVLLSLGSTSAVANVVAGIVITFTRAFKMGDRVKISNTEGDVIERSAFVTRLRTPKNVEVSIPNAAVLNNHIINYSAQAQESGLTLHTSITIGYDVPWPTVHDLLLSAAANTDLIETDPKPYVLQTALDDFYVEYELNATTHQANKKSLIYSDLHANILDAFQHGGVEIMSPHYLARRDGSIPAIPPEA